jgi:hypothetical protein
MINFKRLFFFSGLVFIVLQTQQSIKRSLMFTFQFVYFIIYILAQQSADVEPVSGISEEGPTTCPQEATEMLHHSRHINLSLSQHFFIPECCMLSEEAANTHFIDKLG